MVLSYKNKNKMINGEILEAVNSINQEFEELFGVDSAPYIFIDFVACDETILYVSFPNVLTKIALNTHIDDREHYKNTNTYEPYIDYIKRKYTEVLENINNYQLN